MRHWQPEGWGEGERVLTKERKERITFVYERRWTHSCSLRNTKKNEFGAGSFPQLKLTESTKEAAFKADCNRKSPYFDHQLMPFV